ncbi:MAG: hypothetical protein G8237_14955 [Magnetococcales bacterium]|nr:hypothetical protein [Magnetococcales bacterium]
MKRPLSVPDPMPERVDPGRFEALPNCTLSEAAWMAGVAEEAMRRYLDEANTHLPEGGLSFTTVLRAAFTLLGRKENQASMLRQQLTSALERERELTDTLRSGLLGSGVTPARTPETRRIEPSTLVKEIASPARKKKKK